MDIVSSIVGKGLIEECLSIMGYGARPLPFLGQKKGHAPVCLSFRDTFLNGLLDTLFNCLSDRGSPERLSFQIMVRRGI